MHAEIRAALDQIVQRQQAGEGAAEQILIATRKPATASTEIVGRVDALAVRLPDHSAAEKADGSTSSLFISSTIRDLAAHREEERNAAIRAGFLPILSEHFPASQHKSPLAICRERVAKADVLALIVGHRYGWVPPVEEDRDQTSITWIECATALEQGKEVLAFLLDDSYRGLDGSKERNASGAHSTPPWISRTSENDVTRYLQQLRDTTDFIDVRGLNASGGKARNDEQRNVVHAVVGADAPARPSWTCEQTDNSPLRISMGA